MNTALTPALSHRMGEGERACTVNTALTPALSHRMGEGESAHTVNTALTPALSHRMGEGERARTVRPIVAAVHGILTRQTRVSWPDRFEGWCVERDVHAHVVKKEYVAWPSPIWNVFVRNVFLARGLAAELELLWRSSGCMAPIHFVSHSNGTDVALKTIKLLAAKGIGMGCAVFVGSVLEPRPDRNGVSDLLRNQSLRRAVAYQGPKDWALRIPTWLPWCPYKNLGSVGWRDRHGRRVGGVVDRWKRINDGGMYTRFFPDYGHGTCFEEGHIGETFALFRWDLGLQTTNSFQRGNGVRNDGKKNTPHPGPLPSEGRGGA
jgi:hypothetical protein